MAKKCLATMLAFVLAMSMSFMALAEELPEELVLEEVQEDVNDEAVKLEEIQEVVGASNEEVLPVLSATNGSGNFSYTYGSTKMYGTNGAASLETDGKTITLTGEGVTLTGRCDSQLTAYCIYFVRLT